MPAVRRHYNYCHVSLRNRVWRVGADWIHLAQDRDKWQAHVNTVVNIQVPQTARN